MRREAADDNKYIVDIRENSFILLSMEQKSLFTQELYPFVPTIISSIPPILQGLESLGLVR